jgi:Icc-related predicted phosphoesterase
MPTPGPHHPVRLAALADLHYSKSQPSTFQPLFAQVAETADVLVLCGDLTDYGLAEEARLLAKDLAQVNLPAVAVLGNHDFEANEEGEIVKILADVGAHVLDGDTWEFRGVGFAGVRGFCGGFGRGALAAWGEKIIKDFVHEAVQEALKLEAALARLRAAQRIVLMHYAPIRATIEGEPADIHPFLGSSRLEDPLSRFEVTAVFHGHAHKGSPEGRTQSGIPVYNVSYPLLKAYYADRPPFRLFEVQPEMPGDMGVTPISDRPWTRRSSDHDAHP